jgi:hypothetical protein
MYSTLPHPVFRAISSIPQAYSDDDSDDSCLPITPKFGALSQSQCDGRMDLDSPDEPAGGLISMAHTLQQATQQPVAPVGDLSSLLQQARAPKKRGRPLGRKNKPKPPPSSSSDDEEEEENRKRRKHKHKKHKKSHKHKKRKHKHSKKSSSSDDDDEEEEKKKPFSHSDWDKNRRNREGELIIKLREFLRLPGKPSRLKTLYAAAHFINPAFPIPDDQQV